MSSFVDKRLASLPADKRRLAMEKLASRRQSSKIAAVPHRRGPVPLSYTQQPFWFMQQLNPSSVQYNLLLAARIDGTLDAGLLERSFTEIFRRHESLRTTFTTINGEPVQVVAAPRPFELEVSDVSSETELANRLAEHARTPFDLGRAPLFRAELVRCGPRENVLLINCHHIVSDNWSARILFRELPALYQAAKTGSAIPLPPIQYSDFACWQRLPEQEEAIKSHLDYWRERLSGELPALELPSDRPRPAMPSWSGALRKKELPESLADRLRSLSQRQGTTLFMTLLAAYKALLLRYTGQEDVIVGTPVSGRERPETQSVIGCFVNTVALRTDCSGDPSFVEVLKRVRETCLGAFAHQDAPFERVVEVVQPKRSMSRTPIVQIAFGLRQDPIQRYKIGDAPFELLETDTGMTKFDLMLEVVDTGADLTVLVEYSTELFDAATMDRLMGHYQTLLEGVAATPETSVSLLPLMTEPERAQIQAWNNTVKEYPLHRCLHEIIEDQVDRTPDAIAVKFLDDQLTYRELDNRANQLAHYLPAFGVGPGTFVGVAMERSVDLVVSLVAVLKAGAAYIPIDPDYPLDRISHMLTDSKPAVLLTEQRLLETLPPYEGTVVAVDAVREQIAKRPAVRPALGLPSTSLAYAIYTSGSTGRPKCAMNSHRGIVNRLSWMQDEYRLNATDRVLQKTPFSFDVSVWEFFWPLMTGAMIVVAIPGGHRDSAYLAGLIADSEITTLHFVPSMLQIFLEEPLVKRCRSVRRVICSGEALPTELERRFFTRMPAELHNLYGPTEAAVDVTYWKCDPDNKLSTVPIGRPVANTQIHLLDGRMNPVPVGIAGELCIGGVQVGLGYLNRSELTAEKFVADPFRQSPDARLYRTGDLARYLPDGSVEYLGRLDHQVKVRGFRIELGEIESVLNSHPSIRESVVVAIEHAGDKRLCAYVTPSRVEPVSVDALRSHLGASLPEYMIPASFTVLDELPLSPSGKVDRRALPSPTFVASESGIAPRTEVEHQLVAIWEKVLNVRPIGIRDNFFEIGGHSLAALRVIVELEQAFSIRLPVSALFQSPTIEMLAPLLQQQPAFTWGSTIEIQKGNGQSPLFFVPGGAGNMVYLTDLAPLLGSEQAVYGMRYRGTDGEDAPDTKVEVIADKMLEGIQKIQSHGPYRIGGHCFGGLVAFELARRLAEQGHEIELLAIVNVPAPFGPHPISTDPGHAYWIDTLARAWEVVAGRPVPISARDMEGLDDEAQLGLFKKAMVSANLLPAEADVRNIRGLVNVFRANSMAYYRPEVVAPVPITLYRAGEFHPYFDFSPAEDPGVPQAESTLGWKRFSTIPIEVRSVPGNHLTMLKMPNIETLALALRERLARSATPLLS